MIKYYKNKETSEEIRWDPAQRRERQSLLPGRAGINHWHRINMSETGVSGRYLDANGQSCHIWEERSVIAPKNQDKILDEDVTYYIEELDDINKKIINLFDLKTKNWFHDAEIKLIKSNKDNISLCIQHKFDEHNVLSKFKLLKKEQFVQTDIDNFIGCEIYRIKLRNRNMGNELIIINSKNEELTIFYENFEYEEEFT